MILSGSTGRDVCDDIKPLGVDQGSIDGFNF